MVLWFVWMERRGPLHSKRVCVLAYIRLLHRRFPFILLTTTALAYTYICIQFINKIGGIVKCYGFMEFLMQILNNIDGKRKYY